MNISNIFNLSSVEMQKVESHDCVTGHTVTYFVAMKMLEINQIHYFLMIQHIFCILLECGIVYAIIFHAYFSCL